MPTVMRLPTPTLKRDSNDDFFHVYHFAEETTYGEVWMVTVVPSDGYNEEAAEASITIENTDPVLPLSP